MDKSYILRNPNVVKIDHNNKHLEIIFLKLF
jgi:hypothetical protein